MGLTQIHLIAAYSIALGLVMAFAIVSGDDIILQKRSARNKFDVDRLVGDNIPRKRPFCNAFTGCAGRKRSDESMATLVELNSEPAVEELSKQILSEAKLWEAIQEARDEIDRRRQEQNMMLRNLPLAHAMSNFRRKRSSQAFDGQSVDTNMLEQYNRQ